MNLLKWIDEKINPRDISDLLEEVGSKNFVRVTKHAAIRPDPRGRTVTKKVFDDVFNDTRAHWPALVKQDSLRMALGKKGIYLPELIRRTGGELISVSFNTRTNPTGTNWGGVDFVANALGGTSQPAVADYIAVSNNTSGASSSHASSTVPWSSAQATDAAASTSTGEYTAIGVARAQATYAHTTTVASYTQTKTFTASGAITSLQLAGLFGGSTKTTQGSSVNNILFVENTFTATSMVNLDQLTLTWTINI